MSMTNFTAADMPGGAGQAPAPKQEAPKKAPAAKKPAAPKKPATKKAPAKKVAEAAAPEQTDTETHGVGPSTVEGKEAETASPEQTAAVEVETPAETAAE